MILLINSDYSTNDQITAAYNRILRFEPHSPCVHMWKTISRNFVETRTYVKKGAVSKNFV
jgi:hypothetical protein